MSKHKSATSNDPGTLVEAAWALMTATADVTGEKITQARKRLATELDYAQELAARIRDQAVESAEATDDAIKANPYKAIALGVGIGALLGFLLARKCYLNDD